MKKRRHHFVWQYYLKAWSRDGTKIACRHGDRVFMVNTINAAVERDLYKLHELTAPDVRAISVLMQQFPPELRRLQGGWLQMFAIPQRLRATLGGQHTSVDDLLAQVTANMEEDFHTHIEAGTTSILSDLRAGNLDFFQDRDQYQHFVFYLVLQSFRTRRFRDRLAPVLAELGTHPEFIGLDARRVTGVLRLMLATSTATSFVVTREHRRLTVLEAVEGEFITGDQPVLNTYASRDLSLTPPEKLEFYYPVSPGRAILLGDVRDGPKPEILRLSEVEVAYYNSHIVRAAQQQLYGTSEEVLREAATRRA